MDVLVQVNVGDKSRYECLVYFMDVLVQILAESQEHERV